MNKKRKVVIVGSAYPLRGGLTVYNERFARAYMENGDDVTIFTFSLQYPNFYSPENHNIQMILPRGPKHQSPHKFHKSL
ncbi:MAG: hypothetical protein R2759_01490 [Bacteroidales bacterium]